MLIKIASQNLHFKLEGILLGNSKQMPLCSYRKYTIGEIINSVIRNGFVMSSFDEHPSWIKPELPGEFTFVAIKQ